MRDFTYDPSVLEAASWRLASELVRRHPKTLRLIRTHPGGGQYDCLTLLALDGSDGVVQLNRHGTIQVHARFDGRPQDWEPTSWDTYLKADPREFLDALEVASGLPSPSSVPPSTPRTLTYRVLAAIAATGFKTVDPIKIVPGTIDSSNLDAGPNDEDFALFPMIPAALREQTPGTPLEDPGHRFWFVHRNGTPVLAFEQQQGLAWTRHHDVARDVPALYVESRRHLLVTALKLLRRVDHV
jgi:hypothetical protein